MVDQRTREFFDQKLNSDQPHILLLKEIVEFAENAAVRASLGDSEDANTGTAGDGVTAVESGNQFYHFTQLTISKALPAISGGFAVALGIPIYTFPEGAIWLPTPYLNVSIQHTQGNITSDTPNVGVGFDEGSGFISSLTLAQSDVISIASLTDCNGTAAEAFSQPNTPVLRAPAADRTMYFNAAETWTGGGDAAALVSGTFSFVWMKMS